MDGKPPADFVCPGHPLLDATISWVLETHRDLMRRGAILVAENDPAETPSILVFLEHSVQDARTSSSGQRRTVSRQMQFIELSETEGTRAAGYAPYLDYRPLNESELALLSKSAIPEWTREDVEQRVLAYAVEHVVMQHLDEVRRRKEDAADRTLRAVKDRLTKEINYWDRRAEELKMQELAGKTNARLNSGLARRRADDLEARLKKRTSELEQERQVSALPPVVLGGAMIIPKGLLNRLSGAPAETGVTGHETERIEKIAMEMVMKMESGLGYVPRDVSAEKLGYDVESSIPGTGKLRFIEVKGRAKGADTVCVTKNEILTAMNKPKEFYLVIVEVDGESKTTCYVQNPFQREPDFGVTSVNYLIKELMSRAMDPRTAVD